MTILDIAATAEVVEKNIKAKLLQHAESRESELRREYAEAELDGRQDDMTFIAGRLAECIEWKQKISSSKL